LVWPSDENSSIALDKAGDLIIATPGLGDVIKKSVQGLISYCGDLAHWSVKRNWIFEEFRKRLGIPNQRRLQMSSALSSGG